MDINPYTPPQAAISDIPGGDAPLAHGVSRSELTAFAGDDNYPARWLPHLEGKTRLAGFNTWAALFGIQWFFLRKLYLQGLLALLFELGVPLLVALLGNTFLGGEQRSVVIYGSVASFLGTRIALGYWANLALCQEAVRTIRRVDGLNLDNDAHLRAIARAGGVSVPALLAVYVAMGLARAVPDLLR